MINIINHIEANHIDGISTPCGLCGQVFRTRAALQKHKTSRPDICHEYHEYHEYHESSWRNFSFPCITIMGKLKVSPHVEKFQMSPHELMWRKLKFSKYDMCVM